MSCNVPGTELAPQVRPRARPWNVTPLPPRGSTSAGLSRPGPLLRDGPPPPRPLLGVLPFMGALPKALFGAGVGLFSCSFLVIYLFSSFPFGSVLTQGR